MFFFKKFAFEKKIPKFAIRNTYQAFRLYFISITFYDNKKIDVFLTTTY